MQRAPQGYVLALVLTLIAVAITRLTWPFFSAAPFAPAFGAVALATHVAGAGPGLFATGLGAVGLALLLPSSPFAWNSPGLAIYVAIAVIGNRLIAGRARAVAALRASEAELRASLDHQREADERLRRAQKMEAVGQLAAGVAHNFNNLLQVTMGYTDILADSRRDRELDAEAIAEIRKATERGAALTRQLLAFGRKHDPKAIRVDLDVTIAAMEDMLRRVLREDIELTLALDGGGATVIVDPFDLEQVVFNLAINARDALPEGGAIAIAVARVTVDEAGGPGQAGTPAGEYARIQVRDNGTGMSPDVQSHLFEPFFTTKEVGTGTGLGLAFVDGIARHGGGFVTVQSAPRQGTTVALFLPIADRGAAGSAAATARSTTATKRAATILLVEDEDAVRAMTARMLSRSGYRVLSADGADAAAAIFEANADSIDLLLTDVVMPGMHGPELAARLAARRPDLPVVFVSGYSDEMPSLAGVPSRTAFVPKPFSVSSLVSALEGVLARDGR